MLVFVGVFAGLHFYAITGIEPCNSLLLNALVALGEADVLMGAGSGHIGLYSTGGAVLVILPHKIAGCKQN